MAVNNKKPFNFASSLLTSCSAVSAAFIVSYGKDFRKIVKIRGKFQYGCIKTTRNLSTWPALCSLPVVRPPLLSLCPMEKIL